MVELYKKDSPYALFLYLLVAAFLFYQMAVQMSPAVMTENLLLDLHATPAGLGMAMGMYFFPYAFMQIPVGLLLDRFSFRWILSAAILVCAIGVGIFSVMKNIYWAGFSRFLIGGASAFSFIGVLVIAIRWFSARYFAFLVGMTQLLAALGALFGEAPLAELVGAVHWRQAMRWISWAGFALFLLVLLFVRNYPTNSQKEASSSTSHVHSWGNLKNLLNHSQLWRIGAYAFCSWTPVTVFAGLWGIPFLTLKYGMSSLRAAESLQLIWVGIAVASPLVGWLSDFLKRRCLPQSLFALIGVVSSSLVIMCPDLSIGTMRLCLFFFGAAASGQVLSFALTRDNITPSSLGTALGFTNMAVVIGGALFQPLVGYLLDHFVYQGLSSLQAFQWALGVVPLCYLVGFVCSWLGIQETRCQPRYLT